MGGPGSGRWYRWQGTRTTLEEVYRLDVRWLHWQGYLDGRSHWVTWSRGEQQVGSLLLALQPEGVVLTYRYRLGGGDWESVRQVVTLDWTPCHYGVFCPPPDRVYSRDSMNQTHVGVPWTAKIKVTTCI